MSDIKNDGNNEENNDRPVLTDEEIENLDLKSEKMKKLIKQYKKQIRKHAIWRDTITVGFKKWLRGEKIYDRNKVRISFYIPQEMKNEWQDFIKTKPNEVSSLSDLVRVGVSKYIWESKNSIGELEKSMPNYISKISHDLKEPLTSIKGISQFLLENYKDRLEHDILIHIRNIFDESLLLEKRIRSTLGDIKPESSQYDILLIEDDESTIRLLTAYFKSKGYSCHGAVSGSKGLEELSRTSPKVILLDIVLPDLNGFEIYKKIKSDEKYKEIPIYFLTAMSSLEVENFPERIDLDGYILKPFDLTDFEVILEILNCCRSEIQEA